MLLSPESSISPFSLKNRSQMSQKRDENDDSDNSNVSESDDDDFFPLAQKSVSTPQSGSQSRRQGQAHLSYCSQSEGSIHFFAAQTEKIPFNLRDLQKITNEKYETKLNFSQGSFEYSQKGALTFSQTANSQYSQRANSQFSPTFCSYNDADDYYGSQLNVAQSDWTIFPMDSYRCVPQYSKCVLIQWGREEYHFNVKSLFEKQTRVNNHIRAILIDDMVYACTELKVSSRALFLSVKLLDIILDNENLTQDKLFCTGIACLSLSAKIENSLYPGASRYVNVFNNSNESISENDLTSRELEIMNILQFNMTHTTVIQYIKYWLNFVQSNEQLSQMVMFVAVCSILHDEVAIMRTELVSLAIMAVAMYARKESMDVLDPYFLEYGYDKIKEVSAKIIAAINGVLAEEESVIKERFSIMYSSPTSWHYEIPTFKE